MSVQARVVVLVTHVGSEVRVVWLALSEVVIDDRSEKWQHRHHDGKAHRPHSDKHSIHSRKSIAPVGIFVTVTIPLDRRGVSPAPPFSGTSRTSETFFGRREISRPICSFRGITALQRMSSTTDCRTSTIG